jgi:precorrin-2/cobalt-factor-2 C20-methyltransferase
VNGEPLHGERASGRLFGIGVGPGEPELMTVKAQRLVTACPVVAHFAARGRRGNAWTTIEGMVPASQIVLRLEYPVTTEAIDRVEYERLIAAFYDESAVRIAAHLDAGRDVAVVCEGDPFFYGSYMYVHHRLAHRFDTTVVPGVTSFSAASAAAGVPLVQLKDALAGADAAVVMKVGRHLDDIRDAADAVGLMGQAVYVERASCPTEQVMPLADTVGVAAPYFSIVLIPGAGLDDRRGDVDRDADGVRATG